VLELSLRPEGAEDVPFLHELYALTRAEEMAALPWDRARKDAFLRMQFDAQTLHYHRAYPQAAFQIVLVNGHPAGRLYVHRGDDEIGLIDVALLPEYRRRGIGGELLLALLAEARRLGRRVTLYVERHNPALRLYERLGFRQLADEGIYLFMEWRAADVSEKLTIPTAGRVV
jgi:ribosomal protein S18 acetylase RimI-like enzyme